MRPVWKTWGSRMPPAVWWLCLGMAIQSAGFAFFWPFTTIYVHVVLGRSLVWAGVVLLLQSFGAMVGSMTGGVLFDRMGGRSTIALGVSLSIVTLVAIAFSQSFFAYMALVAAFGFTSNLVTPSMYAYGVTVWPEGGRAPFNAIYVAQNVGVALGTLVSGLVASISLHLTFLATAGLFAVFLAVALLAYRGPNFSTAGVSEPIVSGRERLRSFRFPRAVWILAFGLACDYLAYVQWASTTAALMHGEGFSLPSYSLLWTINGSVILAGQPLVQWVTARLKESRTQLMVGSVVFVLAYLVLLTSRIYLAYTGAMVLTTLGEMLVWPGVPAQASRMAPPGRQGTYQGAVATAGSFGRMLGPLLGGLLYAHLHRQGLYGVMAGIYVLGAVAFALHDRMDTRLRRVPAEDIGTPLT